MPHSQKLVTVACLVLLSSMTAYSQSIPITGADVPILRTLDSAMVRLMEEFDLPGGQLAVSKDGRLVYDRGFGWADTSVKASVNPTTLFRIASCSKPITAVAVLALVEEGKLSLDARVVDVLSELQPIPGRQRMPSWDSITVRHLLYHAGGWDRDVAGDVQYLYYRAAARALGVEEPAGARDIVRFMLDKPLQFRPGSRIAYSNFGYNVLGRVIEAASGQSYEDAVRQRIWEVVGTSRPRIGGTRLSERFENEAVYYVGPMFEPVYSLFCDEENRVPLSYGGDFVTAALDAHGGWVCSASDMVRFMTSLDTSTRRPHILAPQTIRTMEERSGIPGYNDGPSYQATGWVCLDSGSTWTHSGALYGTSSSMWRLGSSGITYAWVCNGIAMDRLASMYRAIDSTVRSILEGVEGANWPQHDFFSTVKVVDENNEPTSLRVSPNPSTTLVTVQLPANVSLPSTLLVVSATGEQSEYVVPSHTSSIDVSGLPSGSYTVSLRNGPSTLIVIRR